MNTPNPLAFPSGPYLGMTLRDWFAGQVLAGGGFKSDSYEGVAEFAYAIADAMLEAREKQP